MPPQNHATVRRKLAAGQLGGVFYLFGADDFLKEEVASTIISAHLDAGTADFNFDQFRGSELDAEALASALQTPPLMADWRVVVVREAQALASSPRLRALIDTLLDRVPPGLALLLLASPPQGSQAQFYKRLQRDAIAVPCLPPDPQDLPAWLTARAKDRGMTLEPDAARALAAAIGPYPGTLNNELAKLSEFAGESARITLEHVRQAVRAVPRHNRWEWFDMVGEGRFAEARAALHVLLEGAETGVGLVIGLGTHLLRLALAANGGAAALESALPPNQRRWLAPRLGRQAKKWTPARLDAALDDLLRADRLLKSAPLDDLQVLEELLLRLQVRGAT